MKSAKVTIEIKFDLYCHFDDSVLTSEDKLKTQIEDSIRDDFDDKRYNDNLGNFQSSVAGDSAIEVEILEIEYPSYGNPE